MNKNIIRAQLELEAYDIARRAQHLQRQLVFAKPRWDKTLISKFQLSHYTSPEVLISLLHSRSPGLRQSDSSTLNDPQEGLSTIDDREIRRMLHGEFDRHSWLIKRYDQAHICCFVGITSRANYIYPGDDLLFWRLYGNDCRGVSITLTPQKSVELVKQRKVFKVSYRPDSTMSIDVRCLHSLLRDLEKFRLRAYEADLWKSLYPIVLPKCDRLMAHRFLHKHPHFSIEREFRAVTFITGNKVEVEDEYVEDRGQHIRFNRICTYVQTPELACSAILSTNSRITIGANVPKQKKMSKYVAKLLSQSLGTAPNVISVHLSDKQYRSY